MPPVPAPNPATDRPVLVVDDEPDVRDLLRTLLEMEGYRVVCAANGREALTHLEQEPRAGLILLDLAMPVMDGFGFRSEMLRDPRLADIPVIIVSAMRPRGEPAAALRPAAVVPKPVDAEALLERVGVLSGSGATGTGGAHPA
jgi:CheY-like chemotaxis protein